jgi:ankyrin repeat protein
MNISLRILLVLMALAYKATAQAPSCDIWKAIREADPAAVQACIDGGTDLGARDAKERTPLVAVVAADGGLVVPERQRKIVTALIAARSDVNAADLKGYTALHYASFQGAFDLIEMLLAAGANVNQENLTGEPPLLLAARGPLMDEHRVKTFTRLLDAKADPNHRDQEGRTALHVLCAHKPRLESPEEAEVAIFEIAQKLLDSGAKLPGADNAGNTPFSNSLREGYFQTAEWLLDKGDSPFAAVLEDYSAIHVATEWGNLYMVDRLVKAGLDINRTTGAKQQAMGHAYFFPKGSTPLDLALIAAHESKDPNLEKGWKGLASNLKQRGGISRTFEEYVKGFKTLKGDSKPGSSKIR